MTAAHGTSPPAVVILAAGEGSRYAAGSGRYKLLEPLADGRPIIRAVCESALAVAQDVVIVQHWHADRLEATLAGLPVKAVFCDNATAGMGASLKCGVQATAPQQDLLLMLADMPFVHLDTIQAVSRALSEGAAMARPFFEGQPGHPVGFSSRLRAALLDLDDAMGAAGLLRRRHAEVLGIEVDDPGCVRDVDVPADLLAQANAPPGAH